MSATEVAEQAERLVARTTAEQNIPFHVEDPTILRQVAAVLRSVEPHRNANSRRMGGGASS